MKIDGPHLVEVQVHMEHVVEKGKKVQEKFMETLFENTDEEGKENFIKTLNIISHNMDLVIKEERTDRV